MSVASIYNSSNWMQSISQLLSTQSTGTAAQTTAASTSGVSSSSDSSSISSLGKLMSQLQSLQTSNPTEFKQLMTEVASQLQTAATKAGANTAEGKMLSALAKKFENVANGGSLSQLQPSSARSSLATYNASGQTSTSQSATAAGTSSASSSITQVLQGVFSSLEKALQGL